MPGGDEVIKNLKDWAERRRAAIVGLAQEWAGKLEAQMKEEQNQEKYWKNRTHNAKNGLFGEVEISGLRRDEVLIKLAHSVEYGVFLELANDGEHAILKPTLDAAIPEIYAAYEKLWKDDK